MSVIAVLIERGGATRVFFDCRETAADAADRWHIERAIQDSLALLGPDAAQQLPQSPATAEFAPMTRDARSSTSAH
jgi:hypothetical protein